jgi:hypothetical protein
MPFCPASSAAFSKMFDDLLCAKVLIWFLTAIRFFLLLTVCQMGGSSTSSNRMKSSGAASSEGLVSFCP